MRKKSTNKGKTTAVKRASISLTSTQSKKTQRQNGISDYSKHLLEYLNGEFALTDYWNVFRFHELNRLPGSENSALRKSEHQRGISEYTDMLSAYLNGVTVPRPHWKLFQVQGFPGTPGVKHKANRKHHSSQAVTAIARRPSKAEMQPVAYKRTQASSLTAKQRAFRKAAAGLLGLCIISTSSVIIYSSLCKLLP